MPMHMCVYYVHICMCVFLCVSALSVFIQQVATGTFKRTLKPPRPPSDFDNLFDVPPGRDDARCKLHISPPSFASAPSSTHIRRSTPPTRRPLAAGSRRQLPALRRQGPTLPTARAEWRSFGTACRPAVPARRAPRRRGPPCTAPSTRCAPRPACCTCCTPPCRRRPRCRSAPRRSCTAPSCSPPSSELSPVPMCVCCLSVGSDARLSISLLVALAVVFGL